VRKSSSPEPHQLAADLARQGKNEEAWKVAGELLIHDPLDVRALVTASHIMMKFFAPVQAYHFARTATQLAPEDDACWTNLGHAASQMWLVEEAERCYLKALEVCRREDRQKILWLNLSALYLDNGRFRESERVIRKLLEVDPSYAKAQANLGFCQLASGNWKEGWKGYHQTIGSDWRPKVQYRDEPEWDGTYGKTVAIYSDQGLGDEISFASVLPDAIDHCQKLILDCDARLAGLFQRSFPKAKVYGSRRATGGHWDKEDWQIDASLPLGQLGEFFRTTPESFPGTPYLVPCPDRVKQWKALFAQKRKPCIGIAWTGGIPKTNSRNRQLTLEELAPLLTLDVHWVSLQYKDAREQIDCFKDEMVSRGASVDLVQYPWATLTPDYDDTAALIASLDAVVCIQTAVAHTAGALGVPVFVLLPMATTWRYGEEGDRIPWYSSLKVVRQSIHGQWTTEIERVRADLSGLLEGAGETAQHRSLRHRLHPVRPDGQPDHRANGYHAPA